MLRTLASTLIVFFYSGLKRTLVAMATYIFHRLVMGKVKIYYFLSQWGYLEFIFTEMFIESFVQIAEFDWVPGQQKG